jgi:hypothetical protein
MAAVASHGVRKMRKAGLMIPRKGSCAAAPPGHYGEQTVNRPPSFFYFAF